MVLTKAVLAWDITTQLAVASGLLALRDAAIPLTPVEQIGKGGLRPIRNWQAPQHHRERTGIVFAPCFWFTDGDETCEEQR